MIEYDKFYKSLKQLELQNENHLTLDSHLPDLIQEAVAESVIQRFETCYNCMWKVLKRYLVDEVGLPDVPNTQVWVYGSRVKGSARPSSDLDMVVFASPQQSTDVFLLKEALDESDLLFKVDLFVWDEVPEQFRKNITAEHCVLVGA